MSILISFLKVFTFFFLIPVLKFGQDLRPTHSSHQYRTWIQWESNVSSLLKLVIFLNLVSKFSSFSLHHCIRILSECKFILDTFHPVFFFSEISLCKVLGDTNLSHIYQGWCSFVFLNLWKLGSATIDFIIISLKCIIISIYHNTSSIIISIKVVYIIISIMLIISIMTITTSLIQTIWLTHISQIKFANYGSIMVRMPSYVIFGIHGAI